MNSGFLKRIASKKGTRYLFFGGKGGVGKTSMATAAAVWFAGCGCKTTIVSTDPTVSLSAMFNQDIGGEARVPIRRVPNLFGLNINPTDARGVFTKRLSNTMSQMNTMMSEDTVSTPCMEEMATFDQFVTCLENPDSEVIVFDTAPTGKTLRELAMPFDWAGFLQKQIQEGSKFAELFPDNVSSFEELERDKKRYDSAMAVMRNTETTAFSLVLLPERLPIEETQSAITGLKKLGIPVQALIINQCILPEAIEGNRFLQARADLQARYINEIHERFSDITMAQLPLFDHDISDGMSLLEIGRLLFN